MKPVLLIGNDINNVSNNVTWGEMLKEIIKVTKVKVSAKNMLEKPFPLFYEEIYLQSIRKNPRREISIKRDIADIVNQIVPNDLHRRIANSNIEHILTTNYEHSLESSLNTSVEYTNNLGVIKEAKYNVFRNHKINDKHIWHIHGDVKVPNSIVLGYEHYSGQLQQMRNYLLSGTNYTSKKFPKESLIRRIGKSKYEMYSWLDLFFTSEIHIIGLKLDFIESDLWWLFTVRARQILEKDARAKDHRAFLSSAKKSKIYYYYPSKYYNQEKDELMRMAGITAVPIEIEDREKYYTEILDKINGMYVDVKL